MADKVQASGGIGVFGLLGVLFVALKLTNYIDWSWWYVTLPFWWWIPFLVSCLLIAGLCYLFCLVVERFK